VIFIVVWKNLTADYADDTDKILKGSKTSPNKIIRLYPQPARGGG
jgi:hypothetical protein